MSVSESKTRLNRYLASCGLGSRRGCEILVREGRVQLNGEGCSDLSARVGLDDIVHVDGRIVSPKEEVVILLNKPPAYLCTRSDAQNRPTIYDLIPSHLHNLHHVGRLDRESEGLLLMTNSGDITERLTHPRHKIEKEYSVVLERPFSPELKHRLLEGIPTEEGFAKASGVRILSRKRLRVTLQQGLKRQIRLMFAALNYNVTKLERIRIGSLTDSSLAQGAWRKLGKKDLASLWSEPPTRKETLH